ncbi:UBP1-associated protein 2B-like [Iris pallida]|uniref:UBP1-associated protein 2B-like n=1 Tax=Iris pallida TaxID=29817 RepID=A0AAX6G0N0_IRIPA|nr:UBP1-associated protein 2B-like [Iris pallida]
MSMAVLVKLSTDIPLIPVITLAMSHLLHVEHTKSSSTVSALLRHRPPDRSRRCRQPHLPQRLRLRFHPGRHPRLLQSFFSKYDEIENTHIVTDKTLGRSKGYAFVCFRTRTAREGPQRPNKTIGNRTITCELASFGRSPDSSTVPAQAQSLGTGSSYVASIAGDHSATPSTGPLCERRHASAELRLIGLV